MDIRELNALDHQRLLEDPILDKKTKHAIQDSLKGNHRFNLNGLPFGPSCGYMNEEQVSSIVKWCKKYDINNLYFFGGQSTLLEVLGEINRNCEAAFTMVEVKDLKYTTEVPWDALQVTIK